jgi:hypothetical protein
MTTEGFKSPRPNLIESDEGFSVEVLGRTGILYKEGDRTMSVYSELLAPGTPCGIAVWTNSIQKWNPPHDVEEIDTTKRTAILENIRRAIRSNGDDTEIIG